MQALEVVTLEADEIMKTQYFILCLLLLGFLGHSYADEHNVTLAANGWDTSIINVGVIVDMGSWIGKAVESCITMALSDFYNLNSGYTTRIALHVRDCGGDWLHSIAAALDLLENVEVHALIIPKLSSEELFLARLGDKANVPILTFCPIVLSSEHPYLIQVADVQFHGIAAFLKALRWRSLVFLYEDTSDAWQSQTYMHDILQENHLDVAYQTAISVQATDDQIINVLHKLMAMKASVILVHLSPSLASQVFVNAKQLGMMSKGFAWIATSKTMNLLDSQDSSIYESMQGVIGFKSYVSESSKIQNITWRWRRKTEHNEGYKGMTELNVFCIWAYDAASVLAEAVERGGVAAVELSLNWTAGAGQKQLNFTRLRVSNSGSAILSKITSSKFTGLMGGFQIVNKKFVLGTYEILNVFGNGGKRVGFWTYANGFTEETIPFVNSSADILETIIWPGFSSTTPESRFLKMSGKNFRIGIPVNGRFPEFVRVVWLPQSNLTIFRGLCIDVFQAALAKLPYSISFEFIPFYNDNGSYSDLVHLVYLQQFDAAIGDITILSSRSEYVDFTPPFSELGVGALVKLDDKDPWFFLKPLSMDLWILSACFFFLTAFVVWLIEHRINEEFQGPPARQVGIALGFAASTLVFAHRERLQSNVSRFVVGIWLFVVFILTSSYIAMLSSLLTVEQIKLKKNDYIGYPANSFMLGSGVRSNLNFEDDRLKPFQSTADYEEVLRKGGVHAIIDEIPYLKLFVAKHPHGYAIIELAETTGGFGFAFSKGSPLFHDISRSIAELREEGQFFQMVEKMYSSQSAPNKPDTLNMDNFVGLFLLIGLSLSIAVLIFFMFLLRERVSIYFNIFSMLARGQLMFILRYLYPRMVNITRDVEMM